MELNQLTYLLSRSLLIIITLTVYWTSTRLVVWKSVEDTHGIACLLCDPIVEPTATMRVQCR